MTSGIMQLACSLHKRVACWSPLIEVPGTHTLSLCAGTAASHMRHAAAKIGVAGDSHLVEYALRRMLSAA